MYFLNVTTRHRFRNRLIVLVVAALGGFLAAPDAYPYSPAAGALLVVAVWAAWRSTLGAWRGRPSVARKRHAAKYRRPRPTANRALMVPGKPPLHERPTAIYHWRAPDGTSLYIGLSCDVVKRAADHGRDGREFIYPGVTMTVEAIHQTRTKAAAEERRLIRHHRPAFNVHHQPGEVARWR